MALRKRVAAAEDFQKKGNRLATRARAPVGDPSLGVALHVAGEHHHLLKRRVEPLAAIACVQIAEPLAELLAEPRGLLGAALLRLLPGEALAKHSGP